MRLFNNRVLLCICFSIFTGIVGQSSAQAEAVDEPSAGASWQTHSGYQLAQISVDEPSRVQHAATSGDTASSEVVDLEEVESLAITLHESESDRTLLSQTEAAQPEEAQAEETPDRSQSEVFVEDWQDAPLTSASALESDANLTQTADAPMAEEPQITTTTPEVSADIEAMGQTTSGTELAQDVNLEDVDPGSTTVAGSSYLGIGFNAGFGDSALGDFSFAAFSKIGFNSRLSLRPSVLIRDDVDVLIPLTLDFPQSRVADAFTIGPFVGGGIAIATGDNGDVGPLLTAGVDVPIAERFTGVAAFNLAFYDDITGGFMFGVGYNF